MPQFAGLAKVALPGCLMYACCMVNAYFDGPRLPENLQAAWDANADLQKLHGQLAGITLAEYVTTSVIARAEVQPAPGERGMSHVDIRAPEEDPDAPALVMLEPFAMGWGTDAPQIVMQVEATLAALPEPRRVIVIPNTTHGQPAADLSREERRMHAGGDFAPFAERVLRTLTARGIEHFQLLGYSQAASTGSKLLAEATSAERGFGVGPSGLFDPPTIVQRSFGKLFKDFTCNGNAGLKRIRQETGVPMLAELLTSGGFVQNARGFVGYARSVSHSHNRAMIGGLQKATFEPNVAGYLAASDETHGGLGAPLLLARAERSRITPAEPFYEVTDRLKAQSAAAGSAARVSALEIPGYGHEMGDHIYAYALLARMALTGAHSSQM